MTTKLLRFYAELWHRRLFQCGAVGATVVFLSAICRAATHYVAPEGNDAAAGTEAAPWRTIQRAVDGLKPGDTALVASGIYRERIEIKSGGTAQSPVTLAAADGARVIVSGADPLPDGWTPADGLTDTWSHAWEWRFPIAGPDDLTHPGDKQHELTGRAEQVLHNGRLLRQVLRREHLAPDTFFADLAAKKLLARLRDGSDPARSEMEASTRTQWLVSSSGVSHVRIRGIVFRHAANHAQRGAFFMGPQNEGWLVEDCAFERANGPGASFSGRGHTIRRCAFRENGQLGFGAWSCHETRLEDCVIERNNTKGYSTDWEAGGCKITMSRGFSFHRCRAVDNRGAGIWYDIGNEKSEIAHCFIANNDEAGIFYEISYGLHAHDNILAENALRDLKPRSAWGFGGITLSSSESCVLEHNTLWANRDGITFREQHRTTPRIDGGGEVRIFNRQHTLRQNVIAHSRGFNVAFWMDTTFFGPHPGGHDKDAPLTEDPRTLGFVFDHNILSAAPGRPQYLFGCTWRPKSRTAAAPAEFTNLSGIADTSVVAAPNSLRDVLAGDFSLRAESPAAKQGAGVREMAKIPLR